MRRLCILNPGPWNPGPWILACITLLAALPSATSAQAVHGELRDANRNSIVPGARLYLLDATGESVDSTITTRAGRFRMFAPAAGEFTMYFRMDGWATMVSEPVRLERDSVVRFDFRVSLVAVSAIRQLGDMIRMDERLQASLPEICGEPLRISEAGMLVGRVRMRANREPVAAARVGVLVRGGGVTRSTLTSDTGVYILCNVPRGDSVNIVAETPDGTTETTQVEIRAGTVSWYDLLIGPRR